MQRLAIIGASYLQEPLIQKAKSMGIETHVFAWAADDVGEKSADFFYPISITEKEAILSKCRELQIDGICSIASDLASITVNYVAANMGLVGNSVESSHLSTNKHAMRECFYKNNDPSPQSILAQSLKDLENIDFTYPVIVKPVDRSGSRGITKLMDSEGLEEAIGTACEQSFAEQALIEEFVDGKEYSVECLSYHGVHHFLALTLKFTTGAPHFVETGHLQPAQVSEEMLEKVKRVTFHALDSLQIKNGASHTELKITPSGDIKIIEIGGRMGGDCIGSSLVRLSTGIDFVRAVIQIALGQRPDFVRKKNCAAAIRFICSSEDLDKLDDIERKYQDYLVEKNIEELSDGGIIDSSSRCGYFLLRAESAHALEQFFPDLNEGE